ncbi:MAG: enoyl-CoA hydratase/isomerase family protein [Spirochaetia bacterium]|nr:enoyl-CoA hydratase/isomerase family protein [Spirochaetia bacterium]
MSLKYLSFEVIENGIAVIKLNRAPDNSLSVEMMQEIIEQYEKAEKDENIRAVILTSAIPGYFSNGLDIDELLGASIEDKRKVFQTLYEMTTLIYSFSKLNIALLNGHAMAGGAILAAAADFRFFIDGPYRIFFSETKIGLGIPSSIIQIIESIVGAQNAKRIALLGEPLKVDAALETGLADKKFSEQDSFNKTLRFVKQILAYPDKSYRKTKMAMRKNIIENLNTETVNTIKEFSDFFDENFEEALLSIKEKRRPKFN